MYAFDPVFEYLNRDGLQTVTGDKREPALVTLAKQFGGLPATLAGVQGDAAQVHHLVVSNARGF